jgi:predicted Rossmann-fold nucleotide-binding protein
MTYRIGIYGSSVLEGEYVQANGQELGRALAARGCSVITGACDGMPYLVAAEAAHAGAEVWGFSPEVSRAAHARAYLQQDLAIYTRLLYVPANYAELFITPPATSARDLGSRLKYRNAISTINADAGIIISGGWGTLNEFTGLIYEGKPIGVLTGTGGLAEELPTWFGRLRKKSETVVLFESDPAALVGALLATLETSRCP